MNRISSSSIRTYSECGLKYYYHYNQKLRSKVISGALLFGSAIDQGLNYLLLNQNDLPGAINTFEKMWAAQNINGVMESLSTSAKVVYADKDFDADLLLEEDRKKFYNSIPSLYQHEFKNVETAISNLKEMKEENGFENLSEENKKLYSLGHWLCLRRKGLIMLESYQKKVLPQIKEVLTVQQKFEIENSEGDILNGYLDLIVTLQNGDNYLLDNKTSSRLYKYDSPKRSQQLVLYYHAKKEEYSLKGVGFVVLYKAIKKNKIKICSVCKNDGSAGRHKTCAQEMIMPNYQGKPDSEPKKVRCNGEFNETMNPECDIDVILNTVPQSAENLVMETFDRANEGINKEIFSPNLFACGDSDSPYRCQFYNKCWNNTEKDLVKIGEK